MKVPPPLYLPHEPTVHTYILSIFLFNNLGRWGGEGVSFVR